MYRKFKLLIDISNKSYFKIVESKNDSQKGQKCVLNFYHLQS